MKPSPALGKCDQCMNMYAKRTSRMISLICSGACAGKGFMPFLKQCSTYFSKRLGHFLRKGIKPFPALEMRHPDLNVLASAWLSRKVFGLNKKVTKSGKSKCPAAARVGINPTPTVAECCNHFDNPLIAKVLHTSAVGTGFIPVLPAADKIQNNITQLRGRGYKANTPHQRGWG